MEEHSDQVKDDWPKAERTRIFLSETPGAKSLLGDNVGKLKRQTSLFGSSGRR